MQQVRATMSVRWYFDQGVSSILVRPVLKKLVKKYKRSLCRLKRTDMHTTAETTSEMRLHSRGGSKQGSGALWLEQGHCTIGKVLNDKTATATLASGYCSNCLVDWGNAPCEMQFLWRNVRLTF